MLLHFDDPWIAAAACIVDNNLYIYIYIYIYILYFNRFIVILLYIYCFLSIFIYQLNIFLLLISNLDRFSKITSFNLPTKPNSHAS